MKTLSRLLVSLTIASMLLVATACSSDDLARVNSEVITRAEFDAVLEMAKSQNPTAFEGSEDSTLVIEYKRSLLDTLIENELVRQAAEQEGVEIAEADIDAQIEAIVTGFPDEDTFNDALASADMTMDDLRDNVRDQLLYESLYDKVAPEVDVTDDRIAEHYEENKDLFVIGDESQLSHILFATDDKATAEQILAEIKADGDFAALAKEHSIDPGSGANGGDLGWSSTDMYVPEFKEAADALAVGAVSDLVESDFGWHIILKVDEKVGGQQTLEEVSASINSTLAQQGRSEAFIAYMDKFRADSDIEILDKTLKLEDE
ncbi:MAG: peptidylprolyl isomerase [Coriobacteriia bacterium]|nr:peptidylprolyl isomerase [Coriobacteriia bacterium]